MVPDRLWEIAKPLIPPSKVRPQGGGTPDTPDETLFAAIVYVLVGGCAWRALPPCFGKVAEYVQSLEEARGRGPVGRRGQRVLAQVCAARLARELRIRPQLIVKDELVHLPHRHAAALARRCDPRGLTSHPGCPTFHSRGRSSPQKTHTKSSSRTMLSSRQEWHRRNVTGCVNPGGRWIPIRSRALATARHELMSGQ
nr:transposase [Streptomyces griseoviridis]